MEIPQEIDSYIKESIDDTLGLPVSAETLQLKLRASEDTLHRLHDQYALLFQKSRQKDQLIHRLKAEATMNFMALKKFIEENQRLAEECANLVSRCQNLEKKCSLYENDRELLMDFANEADERATEAEIRANQLEEEVLKVSEELKLHKHFDSPAERTDVEACLVESLLTTLVSKDEIEYGHAFLELLQAWDSLSPSTQKVLSLATNVNNLQKEKELLRTNLAKAEQELETFSRGLNRLNYLRRNKRKSIDSVRQPLSPLRHNSPNGRRMHKK
ncbi:hypothetical protein K2173_023290 [Erythroxylum novogranatense]|uniref:Uncharacterized protein n=1 Tax=Erythroxylum novogranatense TaxID=1862640 RepID=A0AAV8T9X9_9ROSI|nr:hypothetical protein K2173_023290 [Erythroxylum novogranatense]